jgi:hypothetical protein
MDYEAFKAAWTLALRKSRLSPIGLHPMETLDTRTLDRAYEIHLEPPGGRDAPPFHITATLGWHWDALNSARGSLRDEDLLTEMLGRVGAAAHVTEPRYIRADIKLSARAPSDKPLPLPSPSAWQAWVRETGRRMDAIVPLLAVETMIENRLGMTEVLAWQTLPRVTAVCSDTGELCLEAIHIEAWQLIKLPRLIDAPGEPDEGPEEQLTELFERLRASLAAWMQAVDHLKPGRR